MLHALNAVIYHRCRDWLAAFLLLPLTACGADSASTATSQSKAPTATSLVSPLDPDDLTGTWQGLLSCAGRDFPTGIDLTTADGVHFDVTWTVDPALGRRNYISPEGRTEIKNRTLSGSLDPVTGLLSAQEGGAQGGGRALQLQLLLTDDTALLSYQRCEFGLLQPAPASELAAFREELALLDQQLALDAADMEGPCPEELQRWIQAGLDLPLDDFGRGDTSSLWSAAVTEPIFGQPVASLGAAQRIEIRKHLAGRCHTRGDRRRRGIIGTLYTITDYRSFRDNGLADKIRPVAERWLTERAEPLLGAAPAPQLEPAASLALSSVPRAFRFNTLFANTEAFDPKGYGLRVVALNDVLTERRREQDFLDNMRGARFFSMLELWRVALLRDDIADAPANALVAEHLVSQANAQAESAQDPVEAARMADWVAGVEAGVVCNEATERACQDSSEIFADRLEDLADQFFEQETEPFEALEDAEPTIQTLAATIKTRAALDQKYGRLMEYGDLVDLSDAYTALRLDLQREQESALAQQLGAARTTAALSQIDARYFASSDLRERSQKHLQRLGEIHDQQRSGTRPFAGTGSDAYLNALYNREFAALGRMDAELLAKVQPAFRFLAQQISAVGELLGAAGRPLQSTVRELSNPTAATAVALRYLLDYEDRYEACLGSNAATVTFTEQVDQVTRTAGGIELSRIRGVPVSTRYRIKRAHLDLFQDVFTRPESAGSDRMLEALFGLDGVTQLTDAVVELMDEHDCDSEAVKGFERGLLAYYADRKRRWGR